MFIFDIFYLFYLTFWAVPNRLKTWLQWHPLSINNTEKFHLNIGRVFFFISSNHEKTRHVHNEATSLSSYNKHIKKT